MYPNDSIANWYNGQGHWPKVLPEQWKDWKWQLKNRITRLDQLENYLEPTQDERDGCRFAKDKLAFAVTPYFFNLIDPKDPNDPLRRQVIPQIKEQYSAPEETLDPVSEETTKPTDGIIHRYPDRVLFLVTDRCAAYCRYCTRSRLVSNAQNYNFHPEFENGLAYIRSHEEVRDVLLSGGDPLLLSDSKLNYLLGELRSIPHVEFIRIGSRIPVFLPQRITPELCAIFKQHGPIWLNIHVNHPNECSIELKNACDRLSFSGVPLGNQSVLLKGINDQAEIMKSLIHRLLMMRVRPYYIYQCDLITGSSHLRADVRTGIEIIRELRGHTTGHAVPQFVIDAPGGGGKIPINPDYVKEITATEIIMNNFQGKEFRYPLVRTLESPIDQNIPVPESILF